MQIEEQQTIKLKFWSDDKKEETLIKEYRDTLMSNAYEHIWEMRNEGYTSGELCEIIVNNDKEYDIYGWWEVNTINI